MFNVRPGHVYYQNRDFYQDGRHFRRDWPIYWAACISQPGPEISCNAEFARENALGLSGMHEPETLWSTGQLDCPSAWTTLNPAGSHLISASPLPLPWQISQPHTPHDPSARHAVAHTDVGETDASYLISAFAENHPVQMSVTHPRSKHVSEPRPEASHLRYTPYSLVSERTRSGDSCSSVYQCQWSIGAQSCGAVVAHNRNAISHHLQTAHGVRIKADKTSQDCRWGKCRKSMRRESLPRHILAVHMREKVLCTDCDSRFARTDSLQRHQRTCCLVKGEKTSQTVTRQEHERHVPRRSTQQILQSV